MKYTAELVKLHIDESLVALRKSALERGIPVADDESLNYLLLNVAAFQPKKILEIGTAVGLSALAMLSVCKNAHITTIECEEDRWIEAKQNFRSYGVSEQITAHLGDAGEILNMMSGTFDFIFLDGPKAQYVHYLPDLKRLLNKGGILFSDDGHVVGWSFDRKIQVYPLYSHLVAENFDDFDLLI